MNNTNNLARTRARTSGSGVQHANNESIASATGRNSITLYFLSRGLQKYFVFVLFVSLFVLLLFFSFSVKGLNPGVTVDRVV